MEIYFLPILFVVAFLYSSIGHGGASGYLALMAIFGVETYLMKSTALTLNLFVAGVSFYSYYKGGFFKWKILLPFVLASMPTAFFGAKMNVDPTFYKISLGVCLIIAVVRMLVKIKSDTDSDTKIPNFAVAMLVGAVVGFFSGMIGIGGGIVLSPILLLFGWANVKEAACISAGFIWLNSLTGLIGASSLGVHLPAQLVLWLLVALAGGYLGSWSGSYKFSIPTLRYLLASVLVMASVKLFLF